ncbi:hypothetical protein KIV45_24825 [Janthinobacterium lividum]|nr:hypothetical protein KIV45_24825 [Janthinobacterium lividum]
MSPARSPLACPAGWPLLPTKTPSCHSSLAASADSTSSCVDDGVAAKVTSRSTHSSWPGRSNWCSVAAGAALVVPQARQPASSGRRSMAPAKPGKTRQ